MLDFNTIDKEEFTMKYFGPTKVPFVEDESGIKPTPTIPSKNEIVSLELDLDDIAEVDDLHLNFSKDEVVPIKNMATTFKTKTNEEIEAKKQIILMREQRRSRRILEQEFVTNSKKIGRGKKSQLFTLLDNDDVDTFYSELYDAYDEMESLEDPDFMDFNESAENFYDSYDKYEVYEDDLGVKEDEQENDVEDSEYITNSLAFTEGGLDG